MNDKIKMKNKIKKNKLTFLAKISTENNTAFCTSPATAPKFVSRPNCV